MSDISYPSPTVTISEASLSEFSTEGVFIGSYDGPGRGDIENNFEEYLARLFANS
ncbi:serine/threonine-protein kinase HipA, partial [Roseicitreum antarcticum]